MGITLNGTQPVRQNADSLLPLLVMVTRTAFVPDCLQAALEAVWHVPCGGITYGDDNLCFIANDWHTALLPVYLQVSCC